MSKMEILAELPKLEVADRREIFDRICEMEERDLITGGATDEEKKLLDRELAEYRQNPKAGSSWSDVEARLRKSSRA
jgi:putative addiction module component (TIGR02574 family)